MTRVLQESSDIMRLDSWDLISLSRSSIIRMPGGCATATRTAWTGATRTQRSRSARSHRATAPPNRSSATTAAASTSTGSATTTTTAATAAMRARTARTTTARQYIVTKNAACSMWDIYSCLHHGSAAWGMPSFAVGLMAWSQAVCTMPSHLHYGIQHK